MTQQTPADELREAAEKLRALAQAVSAPDARDQAFHAEGTDITQGRNPGVYDVATAQTVELADFIAAMDPRVALAVADWLKDSAVIHLPDTECGYCGPARNRLRLPCPALAVARAILGRPAVPAASEETGR